MVQLRFIAYLLLASAGHAVAAWFLPEFSRVVDLFLILTVITAREASLAGAIVAGIILGLMTDTLAGGGLYGLYGFADTVTAYMTALIARRLVVQRLVGLFLMLLIGATIQQIVLAALVFTLIAQPSWPDLFWAIAKVIVTGVLGVTLYSFKSRLSGNVEQWRHRQRSRIRLQG